MSMSESITSHLTLTIGHLYPDQLNLYGDRGNILALRQRCRLRGIELQVVGLGVGDALAPDEYDMLFIGGGQDKEQAPVAQDLNDMKGIGLWAAIEDDMPVLAVCGGFQLLAQYYRPANGADMKGLGVFDAWTIHKGAQVPRCTGNVAIRWNGSTLVGFENHGGRTYLGTAKPLGKVLKGYGNNAEDGTEGAIYRHAYGTYMHGSLLPKNPHFADYLIQLALQRKYGANSISSANGTGDWISEVVVPTEEKKNGSTSSEFFSATRFTKLTPLDDTLEWEAHASMLERMGLYTAATTALQAHRSS
ncbi:MAG: glutamine amidotransferase [Ktedonobacteraceae bacterium]